MKKQQISLTNILLMFFLITFWGSSFVIVKAILKEGLTPIAIATFRFLLAGLLFIIVLFLNRIRNPKNTLFVEKKDMPTIIILAFSGVTIFFIAQYTGIKMANASIASILVCLLSPILISLLSLKIFKEKLSKTQLLGITTAAIGTTTVILGGTPNLETNLTFLLGSLILLSTPILWTTYTLIGKNIMKKYDPFLIVSYVNIIGGLFLIPFSLVENSLKTILTLTNQEWLAISYLAITCSVLGYFIWFHVMKHSSASATSSFLFAEPLVTVVFATILIKEEITIFTISGGFLILTGLYLITTKIIKN
ncbi:MAG: DMT family transporter [Candidatus Bathyarchaeota archaeon]